ncbi:MAG: MerR family transcriptional regulator [Gammaproteobacteria bacterium]|nr:MerR family transcriptional regulator [Gammaproteobacteria bacterium]
MDEDVYKIGAVARRTGISPECLRAWERRYGLTPAQRAGKTRFYSASQVDRLTSVKALLDQGHPISQLIQLSDDELQRRLRPSPRRATVHRRRTGLVGGQLILAHREAQRSPETTDAGIEVAAQWTTAAELKADHGALPELDCLVVYVPTLDNQQIENIEQIFPDASLVVAFRYATAADLEACRQAGRSILRWPADWQTLARRVTATVPVVASAARRYSDGELLHISLMASQAGCECPRHLAELIGEINDYESHARRCTSVGGVVDQDHRLVAGHLGAARGQLEESLHVLVEKHGLLASAN